MTVSSDTATSEPSKLCEKSWSDGGVTGSCVAALERDGSKADDGIAASPCATDSWSMCALASVISACVMGGCPAWTGCRCAWALQRCTLRVRVQGRQPITTSISSQRFSISPSLRRLEALRDRSLESALRVARDVLLSVGGCPRAEVRVGELGPALFEAGNAASHLAASLGELCGAEAFRGEGMAADELAPLAPTRVARRAPALTAMLFTRR